MKIANESKCSLYRKNCNEKSAEVMVIANAEKERERVINLREEM